MILCQDEDATVASINNLLLTCICHLNFDKKVTSYDIAISHA